MRVLMTGGGTAGHINPALAIADKIKEEHPDAEILFVGAAGRMETLLVPKAGYAIREVKVSGFSRRLTPKGILHNVAALSHAVTAGAVCAGIIREFRPDVAVGTGGYVSGPILRKAAQMGVPVVVHEANALPGVTVKMLCRYAKKVLVCGEEVVARLPAGAPVVVTGNPVKSGFGTYDREIARAELGVADDRPLVLSFGGSLGAARINEAMKTVLMRDYAAGRVAHIHATGRGEFDAFAAWMKMAGLPAGDPSLAVRAYIDDMPRCMAAADLVICRCGAMTLAELPMAAKPAVLIPSPYVAENHQYYNAQLLVDRGAAVCIEEKDLTGERLAATVEELTADPARLKAMSAAAAAMAIPDATERIYREIMAVMNRP